MKMPVMFLVYKRLAFRHMGQATNTSRLNANCRKQNRTYYDSNTSRIKRHGHTGETACPCYSFRIGPPFCGQSTSHLASGTGFQERR